VKPVFVDANVFLRFFTKDEGGQHARAERLFRTGAEGKAVLVSGPPVLFEVAWTLRAAYRQSAEAVLDVLEAVLALPGLSLTDASVCADALRRARAGGVEFADAYIAALAAECGAEAIATFNVADFQRLGMRCHAW
jgi:predicted nucleic acid-binding protein